MCKELKDTSIPAIRDIMYASGAALLMRVDLLKKFGLWDEDFFMYHEDMEYSLRLKSAGYRCVMVRESVFFHKYQFSRSISKYYWMERNRFAVLLMYFKWPTLVLLAPMITILECGMWISAIQNGWTTEKKKVYKYWFTRKNWKGWLQKRRGIQRIRIVRDRDILKQAATRVLFQEQSMEHPLLKYVGNPLMHAYYWCIIRPFVWI